MSLHNGIDTCAVVSNGVYSETFGSANKSAIANLAATLGLIEDAIKIAVARQFLSQMLNSMIKNASFGSKT